MRAFSGCRKPDEQVQSVQQIAKRPFHACAHDIASIVLPSGVSGELMLTRTTKNCICTHHINLRSANPYYITIDTLTPTLAHPRTHTTAQCPSYGLRVYSQLLRVSSPVIVYVNVCLMHPLHNAC
eukprot:1685162-Pleurochrysis_carterae.AAC.1